MAFNELFFTTKQHIAVWYTRAMDMMHYKQGKYYKYIGGGLAVLLLAISALIGFRWYVVRRDRSAQYAFGITLDQYVKMQDTKEADFVFIAQQAADGYAQYKRSAVAPFFIVLQAEALLKADKKEEALRILKEYSPNLSTHNPVTPLFKMKLALMSLDSAADDIRQEGLTELQALAQDARNSYRDSALYQLFKYYWVHGNIDQARTVGQELLAVYGSDMRAPSPWVDAVAQKLATIGA